MNSRYPPERLELMRRATAASWTNSRRLRMFWARVIKSDGCWEWSGATNGHKYGRVMKGGRWTGAHRVSWVIHHGKIPDEALVLHRCDNPSCVNPAHLFLGTQEDNIRDMVRKGRHAEQKKTHCPRGHAFVDSNVYRPPDGQRCCRTCRKSRRLGERQRAISKRCIQESGGHDESTIAT